MLALTVLALVVIDAVIIGMYTIVEGVRNQLEVEKVLNRENPQEITGVRGCQRYIYLLTVYVGIYDSCSTIVTLTHFYN